MNRSILLTMAKTSWQHLDLVCRQEELAYALGVSRVSIGKALPSMGFIRWGYRQIQRLDPEGLLNWIQSEA